MRKATDGAGSVGADVFADALLFVLAYFADGHLERLDELLAQAVLERGSLEPLADMAKQMTSTCSTFAISTGPIPVRLHLLCPAAPTAEHQEYRDHRRRHRRDDDDDDQGRA